MGKTKSLVELKAELLAVEAKIKRLQPNDSYLDNVSKSFHLGMVGGSGKNTYRLNKRREASLDKTIKAAVELCPLYRQRDLLYSHINYIESGKMERDEIKEKTNTELRAEYWKRLNVGDELEIGNPNGNPIITKKNAKSCETGTGVKWTATEIIGKEKHLFIFNLTS